MTNHLFFNPVYAWHPCNIYHQTFYGKDKQKSAVVEVSPAPEATAKAGGGCTVFDGIFIGFGVVFVVVLLASIFYGSISSPFSRDYD